MNVRFFSSFFVGLIKKTDIYLTGSRSRISKSKFKQFDVKMFSYIEKNVNGKKYTLKCWYISQKTFLFTWKLQPDAKTNVKEFYTRRKWLSFSSIVFWVYMYKNISYLVSKNYVKKIEQNIEISIFMCVLLILQHFLHCFSFVGL